VIAIELNNDDGWKANELSTPLGRATRIALVATVIIQSAISNPSFSLFSRFYRDLLFETEVAVECFRQSLDVFDWQLKRLEGTDTLAGSTAGGTCDGVLRLTLQQFLQRTNHLQN
jgi:hypothetical protein